MRLEPRGMTALTVGLIAVTLLVPGCNQPVPLSSGGPVDSSVSAEASAPAAETSAAGAQTKQAGAGAEAAGAGEAGKAAQPAATADAGQAGGGQTADAAQASTSAGAAGSAAAAATVPAGTAPAGDAAKGSAAAPGGPQAAADAAAKGAPAATATEPPQEKPPAAEQAAPDQSAKQAQAAATKNIVKEAGKTPVLTFEDLYSEMTVRGVKLSDQVNQLAGKKVEMTGFMAPPLTAKVNFFVLTKVALTVCPFCSTDADWPTDIVVVFMPKGKDVTPTEHQVKVTGTLSVGSQTDEETGFVSLIRINADSVEVLK